MRSGLPTVAKVGLALHLAALACLVAAYSLRDSNQIEGVYFNSSVGAPDDPVLAVGDEPITVWLVAGAVLLIAGTLLLLRVALGRGDG